MEINHSFSMNNNPMIIHAYNHAGKKSTTLHARNINESLNSNSNSTAIYNNIHSIPMQAMNNINFGQAVGFNNQQIPKQNGNNIQSITTAGMSLGTDVSYNGANISSMNSSNIEGILHSKFQQQSISSSDGDCEELYKPYIETNNVTTTGNMIGSNCSLSSLSHTETLSSGDDSDSTHDDSIQL